MIEFETLAIKANTDKLHAIFLLKKNVQADIIKTILGYPPITTLETLKKWKVVSKLKAVDSNNFDFLSHFYFLFDLSFFILFLELELGLK